MFLFMETTINGVFLSLDLFQFFVFWEVDRVLMYFLIAVWGGPRKRQAAFKFFMYTFLASLPLLVAIFAFYFYSNPNTPCTVLGSTVPCPFDMRAIIATTPIPAGTIGDLMFVALLIAFGPKLPTWPLHTWLPDAHVEAPTGGSVILAGILLKLGGYGLIRFNVQMIPQAAVDMYWLLALAGVISILYGAVVCLAQDDLKRLVAFSSVSHMGFVTLGIAAGVYGFTVSGRGAVLGFSGAIFQMFAHGLVAAALFMVAGSLGHKIGTRNISELGGIAKRAPRMATFMMISFMASLGLPGLVGFVAEFSVFIGVYAAFGLLVLVPILTVILTAAYYIWAMQGAIFGPPNPKWETMPDLHRFEVAPLAVLVASFAIFGIVPLIFLAFLAILASRGFIRPEEPHQGEYYALMLLAVVGMMFTAAATDLFVLFLAFETSSLSTFALVAFRKRDKQATEAAVKFFIIGAVSSGIILFGISLIYGIAGTTSIGKTTTDLLLLRNGLTLAGHPEIEPPLIIALVLLIAGFGFKVAVVPFHMWAPDVYQGSPTTISVLLTSASKNVGIVALFRVFLIGLLHVQVDWVSTLAILAIVTQTVGNVVAIPQRSIKRMLAYSSIAQAGYILIALAVGAIALQSSPPHTDNAAYVAAFGLVGGMLHVFVYGAMKAGSFLVVAGTESRGIPDDIEAYKGLSRRMPFMAFSMLVFLLRP